MVKVSEGLTFCDKTFECTHQLPIEYLCLEKGTILKYPFVDHAETPTTKQVAFVESFCGLFKFIIRNSFMPVCLRDICLNSFFFVFLNLNTTYPTANMRSDPIPNRIYKLVSTLFLLEFSVDWVGHGFMLNRESPHSASLVRKD